MFRCSINNKWLGLNVKLGYKPECFIIYDRVVYEEKRINDDCSKKTLKSLELNP